MPNSPADKRILLIRLGRLGDMVMVAPAIRYLIEKNPSAKFTLLTTNIGAQLYKDFDSSISSIWTIDDSLISKLIAREKYRRLITKSHFDQIFCFENVRKITQILDKARGEIHIMDRPAAPPETHASILALDFVGASGASISSAAKPYIKATKVGTEKAVNIFREYGINKENYVIALHPAFSAARKLGGRKAKARKLWPAQKWGELAQKLCTYAAERHIDLKVIMYLTPSDRAIGENIVRASDQNIVLMTPKPDLESYIGMLTHVNLLVSTDTGPMHLAAAVGIRIVSLFAGTGSGFESCEPYTAPERLVVIRAGEQKNTAYQLSLISVDDVFSGCRSFIDM